MSEDYRMSIFDAVVLATRGESHSTNFLSTNLSIFA